MTTSCRNGWRNKNNVPALCGAAKAHLTDLARLYLMTEVTG